MDRSRPKYSCSEKEARERFRKLESDRLNRIKELYSAEPIHTIDKIAKILVDGAKYIDVYYPNNSIINTNQLSTERG